MKAPRFSSKQLPKSIALVALGVTILFFSVGFAAAAGETSDAACAIVIASLCLGGAIVGAGALMPFGLAWWGAGVGLILLVSFCAYKLTHPF
jgi:hypothetical protein